jgi:lysophospholipase L1-like esterase
VEGSNWAVALGLITAAVGMRIIILNWRWTTARPIPHLCHVIRRLESRRSPERIALLVVLVVLGLLLPASPAEAQPLPDRMTAIGDSISQATNTCCWYGNHPGSSWSTGGRSWDGVRSHYEHIRGVNPQIRGNNHNASRAGARMAHAAAQAAGAVEQRADYVTILMGANDACTSSSSTMTSVEDFRAQFEAAMQTLQAGLPRARVFVSSIPNLYHLWEIYKDSSVARFVWKTASICQSMLAASNTEENRQAVLTRVREFNDVLAEVCGLYPRCRFDDYKVFNYPFERKHVSKLDFFHPSLSGQQVLASITWAQSWWPAVP